ncbi:MAG: Cys-tRNA(Pro) deacylase [Sulfobacillus thermotolerans]|uniref:Cys-tRNA(Pro)/Cys-tRNA(Cys) deacylase n=1 Tax=Sulfobacillus thermotolerans TaxID=338644 RepID=A0ABN5GY03_9FIRM|nr:aminoacyl-tRNA deacylase [Sulfobacillus thermotolerans]MCY0908561.1 Cys-tRNA(Pro) deacylase [Sulfobacillus thermotolerans]
MAKKTMACRILDTYGIAYELHAYAWSEDALDALSVAKKLEIEPDKIFKTLVLRGDRTGILVAVIPGPSHIDLKRLAMVSHNKRAEMVPVKELPALTGYVRGGVSPLGMKKSYLCYVDRRLNREDVISISAGQRGLQIFLRGTDLIRVLNAKIEDIITDSD